MSKRDPLVGKILAGRYRLEELLSRGGMGVVYRAVQEGLDRLVAIKLIQSAIEGVPGARERFRREARAVARLNHPGVAQVYDFGETDEGNLYIAMEFVRGQTLRTFKHSPPDLGVVLEVFDQILAALAYTHARGVIHRDIKPENILLTEDEDSKLMVMKLVDFGIATTGESETELTREGATVGSPYYMAPEQASGKPVGPAADLYSVGAVLYQILANTLPFMSLNPVEVVYRKVKEEPPRLMPRPEFVGIPNELIDAIMPALALKPEDRYRMAADFRAALEPFRDPLLAEQHLAHRPRQRRVHSLTSSADSVRTLSGVSARSPAGELPLIGRLEELRVLEDLAEEVAATQRPHLAMVESPMGGGKSHLVTCLRQRMEESGRMRSLVAVFRAGVSPDLALRSSVDTFLDTQGLGREALEERLQEFLHRKGVDDPRETQELLDFLRPAEEDETSGRRQRSFGLLERLFRLLTRERPLLVLFEDLQWGTGQISELLEHLLVSLRVRPAPIYIVASFDAPGSDEARRHLGVGRLSRFEGSEMTRVRLQPLTLPEVRTLVRAVAPIAVDRVDEIAKRSGGNPMFVVQLARFIRDRPEAWEQGELPVGLHDVLSSRIETVCGLHPDPERLRSCLSHCALLGDPISVKLLEAVYREADHPMEQQAALLDDLDLLCEEGFLADVEGSDGDLLHFQSHLLREHLLGAVRERRARRVHGIAVDVLSKLNAEGKAPEGAEDAIARHAELAGDGVRALALLVEAAEQHLHRGAYERAIELSDRALLLSQRISSPNATVARRALVAKGAALFRLSDFDKANQIYQQLIVEPDRQTQVESVLYLARISALRQEFRSGRSLVAQAQRLLTDWPEATDSHKQRARLIHADIMLRSGRYGAVSGALRPLLVEPANDELQLGALRVLGVAFLRLGDLQHAELALDSAVELAEQRGEARTAFHLRCRQADRLRLAGNLDGAAEIVEPLRSWVQASDRPELELELCLGDAESAAERKDFDRADALLRHGSELACLSDVELSNLLFFDLAVVNLVRRDSVAVTSSLDTLRARRDSLGWLEGPVTLVEARLASLGGERSTMLRALRRERSMDTAVVDPRVAGLLEELAPALALDGQIYPAREALARAQSMWRTLGRQERALRCGALRDRLVD